MKVQKKICLTNGELSPFLFVKCFQKQVGGKLGHILCYTVFIRSETGGELWQEEKMKKEESMKGYIRNKQTFHRLIINMALAMNSDEDGIMNPEEKWKILFDDLITFYENEDEEQESIWDTTLHLKGLYYRRTFSYQEINALIEGVLASKALDTKSANALIDKIEENLTTKFYKKGPKHICKVREPQLADRNLLQDNLRMIQKAIDENVQIAFRFNGYTYRKRLEAKSEKKHQVSPYYIVASGGRYYLLACKPIVKNGNTIQNMSIWRIDLMTELEVPKRNEALGIVGESRIPKRNVENLPLEWEDDFDIKNLMLDYYSAYEKNHRNEPDYKNKVIENAQKVQEFIESGEYLKAWLHYKEDPYIEMNRVNVFDCDNSNRTCRFMEDVYQILWGWKPTNSSGCFFTRFKDAGTKKWMSYEFGGDTMNSFQTTYNRFENVKNKSAELEKFAWNCGKIGNFVLVPAGFNRYRYSYTLDYWDSSLKLLKGKNESDEWNSNGRKVIWDSQYFNRYINTFFLWDYVQKKDDGECE